MGLTDPSIIPPVASGNVCIGVQIEFQSADDSDRASLQRMLWEINLFPDSPYPNYINNSIFEYFYTHGSPAVQHVIVNAQSPATSVRSCDSDSISFHFHV